MLSLDAKKSITVLTVLTLLATTFVCLRLSLRWRKQALALDDYLIAFALGMLYLQDAGAFLLAIKGGEGKPMQNLTLDEVTWFLKMSFWPELGYTILIATIKLSILISFKHIFQPLRWFRIWCYILGILVVGWFLSVFFSVLFQCTPVSKAWQPMKPGHCIDMISFLWGNSISNTLLDYLTLLSPIVPVWKLQMSPVQKALVLGSFLLGTVACVASTMRAVATGTLDETDLSRSYFNAAIWTYIEPSIGIISSCLPFLAKTFGQRALKFFEFISKFGSRTTSLLRLQSDQKTASKTTGRETEEMGIVRHDTYELVEEFNGSRKESNTYATRIEAESVQHLV